MCGDQDQERDQHQMLALSMGPWMSTISQLLANNFWRSQLSQTGDHIPVSAWHYSNLLPPYP
jgi:hypothetical protein